MAMKVNAGETKRVEMLAIWPQEIVVDLSLNGRIDAHSEEVILDRVRSFERVGQLQPITVRRIAGQKVQLVAGYCRHAAAVKYNELHPDAPMRLECKVQDMNDEEALQKNIIENMERNEVGPLDYAFAQRMLRERFQWTDGKIAELYHCTVGYISSLKKLLLLPSDVQKLVKNKTLPVQQAMDMANLSEQDQREILAEVISTPEEKQEETPTENKQEDPTSGFLPEDEEEKKEEKPKKKKKRVSQAIKQKTRAKLQKQGKGLPRTLAEVKDFFTSMTGPAEIACLRELSEVILNFIAGKTTEDACARKLLKVCGDKSAEDEE